MSYQYDIYGRLIQPQYPAPPQYQQPLPPPTNDKSELEYLRNRVKDMERGMMYGQGNQPNYSQPSNTSYAQSASPPISLLAVTTESEIEPHIKNFEFIMSGKKLHFYIAESNEYMVAWHDASIPKTIKKRFKEEVGDSFATDNGDEATVAAPIGDKPNYIIEYLKRLENEVFEIKAILKNPHIAEAQIADDEDDAEEEVVVIKPISKKKGAIKKK